MFMVLDANPKDIIETVLLTPLDDAAKWTPIGGVADAVARHASVIGHDHLVLVQVEMSGAFSFDGVVRANGLEVAQFQVGEALVVG